jgi:hypothetical protein
MPNANWHSVGIMDRVRRRRLWISARSKAALAAAKTCARGWVVIAA